MEKNTKPRTKYNPKNFDTKSGFSDKKKFVKRTQPKGMAVNVYDDDVNCLEDWLLCTGINTARPETLSEL